MVGFCFKMSEKLPYRWLQFLFPGSVDDASFLTSSPASTVPCPLDVCYFDVIAMESQCSFFFFNSLLAKYPPLFLGIHRPLTGSTGYTQRQTRFSCVPEVRPQPCYHASWSRHGYCQLKDCLLVIMQFCSVCTFSSFHLNSYFRGTFLHFEKHLEVRDCWKAGPCLHVCQCAGVWVVFSKHSNII